MKRIVGIDLGTTNSLVAVMAGRQPVVLRNGVGELLTPSVVHVSDQGEVTVGAAAQARLVTDPGHTAAWFKRDMGTDRTYQLGSRAFTATQLSSLVLAQLKADAEHALGEPIEEVVVTVPAYFGEAQRQATRDAATLAGLRAERIINEPTAAAMTFGLHHADRELTAVVLDLGGGTFDVTVLSLLEGVIEIRATAGDARLGGEDFVAALAERVAERIAASHGVSPQVDRRAWARVLAACEHAKCQLSAHESTDLALPGLPLGGRDVDVALTLTRAEAMAVWEPVLARLHAPIARAMSDAKLGPGDVDEVLLVGGATRMPAIPRLAAQLLGRLPLRVLSPDLAVAEGAALQGALKAGDEAVDDVVVTDVAPFTLGVSTIAFAGAVEVDGVFAPLIERGTVLPCSREGTFQTVHHHQTTIQVPVYQGEHPTCDKNTHLKTLNIPVPRGPAGEQRIQVRFTYDLNGLLEVDVTAVSTGRVESALIQRAGTSMSAADLARAREAMARLKFHPRDALPNTTALARAEALYQELTGSAREQLGRLIVVFRGAVERQDASEIEAVRGALLAATEAFRQR